LKGESQEIFEVCFYLTLPLTADLGSVILLHVGLISPTVTMTLCKIKDGCVGLICPTCNAQRSVLLARKVVALCMPIESPYKRNFEDFKKVAVVRILALFSDLRNSTSKSSELACKVIQPFTSSITQILTAPGQGS
jgi:hypothetical protein